MIDHALPVLQQAAGIDDPTRADLHDIFHNTKDAGELAQELQSYGNAPEDVKTNLLAAKQRQTAPPTPPKMTGDETIDKGFKIIEQLGGLDTAEQHPKIATAMLALAAKGAEKTAQAAPAAPATSGKGKTAKTGKTGQNSSPAAPAPRPDGQPHLPAIPENHHRILASDGSIHDLPKENIEQARQIDPNLHVLNPDA